MFSVHSGIVQAMNGVCRVAPAFGMLLQASNQDMSVCLVTDQLVYFPAQNITTELSSLGMYPLLSTPRLYIEAQTPPRKQAFAKG
jgi:hypothetical protein